MADLFIETRHEGDVAFLTLGGEARLELCETLRSRAGALLDAGAKHLVVDVEALGFVDSASTGVLVEMRRKAVAKGGDLTFVRSTARFRRRLADMGLGDQFAFAASEADALAALGRSRKGPTPPAPGPRPSSRG